MRLLLVVLAILVAAPAVAQVGTLAPVDEAADDPSFVLFRARLLEAVATRDTAFVLARLHPDATISFGGDAGVEGFRRLWLEDRGGPDLWTELAAFLPFGSAYETDSTMLTSGAEARAIVPYWFGAWPDGVDMFEHVLVVGENVNVRAAPSADAPVLTQLSHAIVRAGTGGSEAYDVVEGWTPVTLAPDEVGFVARRFARSPIGYRIGFEKFDGRWWVTFFVAGD
jgi:hypothetical protein